ncbi:MAG TPA: hypothetical protein VFO60_00460 [Candidatus Dormibacteraeota bacterium]|nr:hypothetical protein [Candidatus Dormibacteraeota bacterium]
MSRALARRVAPVAILMVLMAVFGYGVYRLLGHFGHLGSTPALAPPADPRNERPAVVLPGTIYVVQDGDLYAMRAGRFTLVAPHRDGAAWAQPAAAGGGRLLAVTRTADHSDVMLVDAGGNTVAQLTHDASPARRDGSLEDNHWAFHPRPSVDGRTLFLDFDSPKSGFLVDFAIWAMPWPAAPPGTPPASAHLTNVSPPVAGSRRWTTPDDYTGGDIEPTPLPGGGILFVRYLVDNTFQVHSQVMLVRAALADPVALTPPEDDCAQPALSPDGTRLAMVCRHGRQTADLEVATLAPAAGGGAGSTLVGRASLVAGNLAGSPTWAPDGSGIAYIAPAVAGGNFQLWWLPGAAAGRAAAPVQVTSTVGLDATSAPAWLPPP